MYMKSLTILSLTTKRRFDVYLVKCNFKLFSTENFIFVLNLTCILILHFFYGKGFLLQGIEDFVNRGPNISIINEMNITTIENERYVTHEFYMKKPRQVVELKLNMIIDKKNRL